MLPSPVDRFAVAREVERLFDAPPAQYTEEHFRLFAAFKDALNRGAVRAAEPDPASKSGWRANAWVKKGILLGFRMGTVVDMSVDRSAVALTTTPALQPFFDKSTYPVRPLTLSDGVRVVPGGSSIRDGSYIGRGVVCMPPMFVNVGAYVGEGTMIDSHALVGSLRPGWPQLPRFRRRADRRRSRTGWRAPGHPRRRRSARRQFRRL